jgi:tetratricopeptide (TPR) repeat protein
MTAAVPLAVACQRAIELHQRGQLLAAQQICEEVLRQQPGNFVALHLCGVIASQSGDFRKAAELIGTAVAVSPQVASAHCNLAIAQRQLRDLTAALASLNRAISLNPKFTLAYLNRAAILLEFNQPAAALADYDRAIAIDGGSADTHHRRGNILRDFGRPVEALKSYVLAESSGSPSAALYLDRGVLLTGLRNYVSALEDFDRALAMDSSSPEAHYNRGVVFERLHDRERALQSYSTAIALAPGLVLAHLNRGVVLSELSRPIEALESFEQAIRLKADLADAHFGRALVLLRLGHYKEGWEEYEWRWKDRAGSTQALRRELGRPIWRADTSLAGKTILLHAEQGFGDTLQFCRYASKVAQQGATVVLEVPGTLVTLLKSLTGPARVIACGDALPQFDLHCPLMSLPLAFRTTLESIPATVPYLRADEARIRHWGQRLGPRARFRVGVVWAGRALSADATENASFNARRDVPVAALAPLGHSGAQFYSLQTGPDAPAQLAQLGAQWGEVPIIDVGSELHDFADTAALIDQLDLVITVDTSTAHVAGALGKPVWILNRLDTCWRWLLDRNDSPWYPTVTLYRQTRLGVWDDVILNVRADLAARIG